MDKFLERITAGDLTARPAQPEFISKYQRLEAVWAKPRITQKMKIFMLDELSSN